MSDRRQPSSTTQHHPNWSITDHHLRSRRDPTAKGPIPAPPSTTATPGPQLVPSTEPNATTAPIEVTGAESIVLSLEATGTEVVFGIPGGAILPTYDPLMSSKKLRHILVRHEQGGGHAAEGDRKS